MKPTRNIPYSWIPHAHEAWKTKSKTWRSKSMWNELVVEKKGTGNRPAKEPEPSYIYSSRAHSFDLLRNLHILPPRKDQIAIQGIAGIEPAGHYRQ